jgi:hypothetical protein
MGGHLLRQQDGWNLPTPTSASSPLELMMELMAAKPFIPKKLAERVGFEPRLSNEINKLEAANGTSNPLRLYENNQLQVLLDA